MALKDANLIPFEVKQRQFLKEVFCNLPTEYMRISPAATVQWILVAFRFISVEASLYN